MPSVIKRKTSHVAESPFTVYAGDEPRPGGYRAVIKQLNMVKSNGDNLMFKPVLEFKASAGSDKSKYDGYPVFPNIVLTDNESNVQKEQAFYVAICGKKDADTKVDGAPEKFKAGDGQKAKVLTIGGVNPVGKIVNVKMRMSNPTEDYPSRLEADMIFAARGEDAGQDAGDDEDDIEDDVDEEQDADLYEEDDLLKLGLPALRKILVEEFGEPKEDAAKIKVKAKLVEAILEAQEEEEDEEEDDEEDEQDDDEEEEDGEEDEEDPEAALRAEFADLDRAELKTAISKRKAGAKFLKSQTDEDLLTILVDLALQDPPF